MLRLSHSLPTVAPFTPTKGNATMLTPDILNAFARRDTAVIADALIHGSLLGTDTGDRVLAAVGNDPSRRSALDSMLTARGYGAEVAG